MKDDKIYLEYILECMHAIYSYTTEEPSIFFSDRKTQKAVLRELQELTECTQRLSTSLKEQYPEISWTAIAGLRNVLVHDYLGINLKRIWNIIEHDLPNLGVVVEAMLKQLETKKS